MDEARIGASCTGALAVVYVATGIVLLLALRPQGQAVDAGFGLLTSLAENGSGWWLTSRWLLVASAVVGIGLVVALRRLAPPRHRTLADWSAAVGLMGFVTLAVHQVRLISHTRGLAAAAAAAGEGDVPQRLVNLSFINLVDRHGFIMYGAVGLWFLLGAAVLLPESTPRALRLLGVLAAVPFFVLPLSDAGWVVLVVGVAALTVVPAFLVWLAAHLHGVHADQTG